MKIQKKYYIIAGLIVLLLIIGGTFFFFWKKSKSQNDSSDEDDEDNEEDWPSSPSKYTNPEWGFSDYSIPTPSPDISEAQAKEEIIKAIANWGGNNWTRQKIEESLVKNSQRIKPDDRKWKEETEEDNVWGFVKFFEKIGEKYQQDIFWSLNPPDQSKFDQAPREAELELFFLSYAFDLEYKNNGEIDWKATLQSATTSEKQGGGKKRPKKEEQWQKIIDYIEGEINPFIVEHGKKFPNLTNLTELNQWTKDLATKMRIVEHLFFKRWQLAEKMKKKIPPPHQTKTISTNDPKLKNKKFDLQPVLTIYKVREEK
ncbi:hypothetical protein [endosymbiont DhMRE of Dentiscutata heterogama]|uniref:hypothetical protein n=1 Tax=endosymbiont DhMRE of Dentiscutata heterogama TaxID=1609546 RepID=UPI002AD3E8F4|nr:hypothetical protein [endosymbiont DhMRE of Dentiscutata heterogama]